MTASGKHAIKIIPAIGFVIIMTGLSASSFDYARAIAAQNDNPPASWNFLANNRVNRIADLEGQIRDQQTVYQNAYWPQQRLKAQMYFLELLKQKLNLTPYSADDWLSLLWLLSDNDRLGSEQLWVIESAIRSNKWRQQRRPDLAYFCIHYEDRLSANLVQECRRVIASLPWQHNLPHLANLVGVEQARLKLALRQAGVL